MALSNFYKELAQIKPPFQFCFIEADKVVLHYEQTTSAYLEAVQKALAAQDLRKRNYLIYEVRYCESTSDGNGWCLFPLVLLGRNGVLKEYKDPNKIEFVGSYFSFDIRKWDFIAYDIAYRNEYGDNGYLKQGTPAYEAQKAVERLFSGYNN